MSKVKIELKPQGVIELFKSPEVQGWLDGLGAEVAQKAGKDYGHDSHTAGRTAICTVFPDSAEAAHENYKNNTILKAAGTVASVGRKPHL